MWALQRSSKQGRCHWAGQHWVRWDLLPLPGPQPAALLLQPHFLQDVFSTREPQNLMTLVPLTLLGTSVQEFGQHIMQQPAAQIQLLGNHGFIPTILGALSGLAPSQEASYASHFKPHFHLQPPKNMSWLGTAMVGEPCTLARMLKTGGRRFASAKNKVEGSEYHGQRGPGGSLLWHSLAPSEGEASALFFYPGSRRLRELWVP